MLRAHSGVGGRQRQLASIDRGLWWRWWHRAGGTMQGYGVKFFLPGSDMAGQNEGASVVTM